MTMRWWERDMPRKPHVGKSDDGQWYIAWRCCAKDNVWARHATNAGYGRVGWRLAIRLATQHFDGMHRKA